MGVIMAGENRWHLMAAYRKHRKLRLIAKLGGKCVVCGESDVSLLEFHHKYGKNWTSNQVWSNQRIRIYEQEAEKGLIELLCDDCHNHPEKHPGTCFCPFCREGRASGEPDF